MRRIPKEKMLNTNTSSVPQAKNGSKKFFNLDEKTKKTISGSQICTNHPLKKILSRNKRKQSKRIFPHETVPKTESEQKGVLHVVLVIRIMIFRIVVVFAGMVGTLAKLCGLVSCRRRKKQPTGTENFKFPAKNKN